jgi:hypothetical protein
MDLNEIGVRGTLLALLVDDDEGVVIADAEDDERVLVLVVQLVVRLLAGRVDLHT